MGSCCSKSSSTREATPQEGPQPVVELPIPPSRRSDIQPGRNVGEIVGYDVMEEEHPPVVVSPTPSSPKRDINPGGNTSGRSGRRGESRRPGHRGEEISQQIPQQIFVSHALPPPRDDINPSGDADGDSWYRGEALQEMPQPVELGLIGGSDRRSTPTMADTALVAGRSSIARNVPTSPSCGIAYNLVTKG
jgi:ribosomal protein S6E (S10)